MCLWDDWPPSLWPHFHNSVNKRCVNNIWLINTTTNRTTTNIILVSFKCHCSHVFQYLLLLHSVFDTRRLRLKLHETWNIWTDSASTGSKPTLLMCTHRQQWFRINMSNKHHISHIRRRKVTPAAINTCSLLALSWKYLLAHRKRCVLCFQLQQWFV